MRRADDKPVRSWDDFVHFYPFTLGYLTVATTIILLLLLFGSPFNCNCN